MTKENFLPNAHCVWEDRWEMCGSSVYFGNFSFLWHLCQLLLRAFGRAGEKGDLPLVKEVEGGGEPSSWPVLDSRRGQRTCTTLGWVFFLPLSFYLQEEISDFCFLLGQKLSCSVSVQTRGINLRQNLCATGHMPSVNFSSLLGRDIPLKCGTVVKHGSLQSWTRQNQITSLATREEAAASGYCAVPDVISGGYFHFHPQNLEFLVTQQL